MNNDKKTTVPHGESIGMVTSIESSGIGGWCITKLLIVLLILLPFLLPAEPIGLVLSGGGAKGAYEVGVWKAMVKTGLATNVCVISGTSVGALNGALFASVGDPIQIEHFWIEHVGELMGPIVDDLRTDAQDALEAGVDIVQRKKEYIEERKRRMAAERGVPVENLLPAEIKQMRGWLNRL